MKGLDGIQGPIYVGTGCVFRKQALYGYDAPVKKKPPRRTCNCLPKWCCCCCSRSKKKNRKAKSNDKKKNNKDVSKQIHALENIEEGIEGKHCFQIGFQYAPAKCLTEFSSWHVIPFLGCNYQLSWNSLLCRLFVPSKFGVDISKYIIVDLELIPYFIILDTCSLT